MATLARTCALLPVRPVTVRRAVYIQAVRMWAMIILILALLPTFKHLNLAFPNALLPRVAVGVALCPLFVAGLNTCLAVGNFGLGVYYAIAAIGIWYLPGYFETLLVSQYYPAWQGDIIVAVAALAFAAVVPLKYLRSDSGRRA